MHRYLLYIINPISGTKGKIKLQQLIVKRTMAANIPFEIYPSVASGDYSFLQPLIKEKKVTDIIISGGDGTVNQVVNSLVNENVRFGIIPRGSGNGLAFAAKIPKALTRALDIIFNANTMQVDGFYINEKFACMLAGLGFDASVAHDFARQHKRGLTSYVKQVIKNFLSAKSYSFELFINGKKLITQAYFISIANSNQFGNNFTIAPLASLNDGLLDIVIVTDQNRLSVLWQTLKQVRGKNQLIETDLIMENKKRVLYFQTDKLLIKNAAMAPLHIDGEPTEASSEIQIEIKKKCFRLIVP
jgi:diacylglycerol kinase (ATP)